MAVQVSELKVSHRTAGDTIFFYRKMFIHNIRRLTRFACQTYLIMLTLLPPPTPLTPHPFSMRKHSNCHIRQPTLGLERAQYKPKNILRFFFTTEHKFKTGAMAGAIRKILKQYIFENPAGLLAKKTCG